MKYNSKKRSKYVNKYLDGKKRVLTIISFILFLIGAGLLAASFLMTDLANNVERALKISGVAIGSVFFLIFLIALVVGRNPIKAKQYELIVKEDRFQAYEKIVEKINVSVKDLSNVQPILIFSPAWNYSIPNKLIYAKKYNKYHYLLEQFQSLTFGKKSVFLYSNIINHATGVCYENKTVEFFYDNIVSLETRFSVEKLIKNYREVLFLEVTLHSGKIITMNLRERVIESPVLENDQLTEQEKDIIAKIKKAIRTRN